MNKEKNIKNSELDEIHKEISKQVASVGYEKYSAERRQQRLDFIKKNNWVCVDAKDILKDEKNGGKDED